MIFNKSNKAQLDRLFPDTISKISPIERLRLRIMPKLKKYYERSFFEYSFVVKNTKERLLILHIDLNTYRTWKGLGTTIGMLMGFVALFLGPSTYFIPMMALVPLLGLIGYVLPEFYVIDKENYRNYKINTEFPQLLDLLKLYSESSAFETFGSALYQISQTMQGVLGRELRDLTSLYRFMSLADFLTVMEKRFADPQAQDLVATVRLAETYGGSVSQKISILASEAHANRMQKAKELGQKSSVALMIPLLLFHFPVALIVFILPVVMNVIKMLSQN